jgi:short-subunit dehydrogenase
MSRTGAYGAFMLSALVTGGTSGIGESFATELAKDGYSLVLVARDKTRLAQSAERLRGEYGVAVETIAADLSDRSQVLAVAERLEDPTRPIDVLVNNAGFGIHSSLLSADTTAHEHGIDVMIRAVLILGGAAARSMRARNSGTIINVSSVAGYITMGSYSAIKAWVTSYTESLAVELRGTGVHVTALTPGWVHTEFHQRADIRTSAIPSALWADSDHVAQVGLRDARRGKVLSTPTLQFRAIVWAVRHIPRSTVRWASGKISSGRRTDAAVESAHG